MKGKRIVALVLCLLLTAALLPAAALADGGTRNAPDTYTVAGTGTVFGTDWDPSDTGNDLELVSGTTYRKTFTVGSVTVSDAAFKVVQNHSWDNAAWPDNNYLFAVIGPGTFTITFDSDSKDITVSGQCAYYPDEMAAHIATNDDWASTGGDWTHRPMTHTDHYQFEQEVTFATAGTKEFKFTNGSWDENYGYGAYATFGETVSGVSDGANIALDVDAGRTVKIRFDSSTKQFAVDKKYKVDITQSTGGTITASAASGYAGTSVQVNAVADSGWALDKLWYNGGYYTSANLPINIQLTDADVPLSATFTQVGQTHSLTPLCFTGSRGSFTFSTAANPSVSVTKAVAGESIGVHATANAGYGTVDTYYVAEYGTDTFTAYSIGDPFEMPDYDVVVWVEFAVATPGYYLCYYEDGETQDGGFRAMPEGRLDAGDLLAGESGQMYALMKTLPNRVGDHVCVTYADGAGNSWLVDETGAMPAIASEQAGQTLLVRYEAVSKTDDPRRVKGNVTLNAQHTITVSAGDHGTVAAAASAYSGDTVPVTVTPDEGYVLESLNVLSASHGTPASAVTDNGFVMPAEDVILLATFAQAPYYTIALSGTSAYGTPVVKNANGQTVTSAPAGETLHVEIPDLDDAYTAVYSVRTGEYGGGEFVTNQAPGETFVMPAGNVWYAVTYYPVQSGYYWVQMSNPGEPPHAYSLVAANLLTEDEGQYTAEAQLTGSGWIYARLYDADTRTLSGDRPYLNNSVTGDVLIRFDPAADEGTSGLTIARLYTITKNVYGNGHITVADSACAGDTVSFKASPAEGYRLDAISVNNGAVTVSGGTFVMPDGDVTIAATFVPQEALSNGFYITDSAEPTLGDLSAASILVARSEPVSGTFSYTGNLTAGTYRLVKVINNALVPFEYQKEDCTREETTALAFTVPASGTQTVYIRASANAVYESTAVDTAPGCLAVTGLYCWNSVLHGWSFAAMSEDDAFTQDSSTQWHLSTETAGYSYLCAVQFENGAFVRSYPANAFENDQYYVSPYEVFGNGNPIPAVAYLRTNGGGSEEDGWQHGCLKATLAYGIVLVPDPVVNGTVSFRNNGNLVAMTVEPDDGYALGYLAVQDESGNIVNVTRSQETSNQYEFTMPASNAYVTVLFVEDADYYVYTEQMQTTGALPGADYRMGYVFKEASGAYYGFYKFVKKSLLGPGDQIRIVKVQNGQIAAQYPNSSYWMELTEDNLDDITTGTEIGFHPAGFPNAYTDTSAVFEDASGSRMFYKCLYGNVIYHAEYDLVTVAAHCTVDGPKSARPNGKVVLEIVPDAGYQLGSVALVCVDSSEDVPFIREDDTITFYMPEGAVTATVACVVEDGYYLFGTMNDQTLADITPAMRFAADPDEDGQYLLEDWVFQSTDAFRVVELENGEIKDAVLYGTSLAGHSTAENGDFVINDLAGTQTVYFRPAWTDAWSGHIRVGTFPTITTQPSDVTAGLGSTATFRVAADNATAYQWQYQRPNETTWNTVQNGGQAATFNQTDVAQRHNGFKFRCRVTNGSGSVLSNAATLTLSAAPTITTQPSNVTASLGSTATFRVVATNATGYQWQYMRPNETAWYDVQNGGRAATFNQTEVAQRHNGFKFRCKVSNAGGSVFSNVATLTLSAAPTITTQPSNATAGLGSTATFKVVATNATSYQWQYQRPNETTWNTVQNGGQAATFNQTDVAQRHNGFKFRCKVSNAGGSVLSNVATLTLSAAPTITTQPSNVTASLGSTATFRVVATNATGYQWQYMRPNETAWYDVQNGGRAATFNQTEVAQRHNGFKFRCKVSNAGGSVLSNVATLTLSAAPTITTQPSNATAGLGSTATFTVVATNATSYQWQYQRPNETAWYDVQNGGRAATFNQTDVAQRHNGFKFRCKVSNAGGSVLSNVATLTLSAAPTITTQPSNVTAALGSTATFKVVASNATSYQWQYQRPNETTWNDVKDNGQSATFNQTNVEQRHNGFQFRCKVTNASGTVYSNVAKLTVAAVPTITSQPSSVSASLGSTATFRMTASNATGYQWQYKRPGETTWNDVKDNGQSATFNQTNVATRHNGFVFRCKVSNGSGSVYSSEATLTVK